MSLFPKLKKAVIEKEQIQQAENNARDILISDLQSKVDYLEEENKNIIKHVDALIKYLKVFPEKDWVTDVSELRKPEPKMREIIKLTKLRGSFKVGN